MLAPGTERLVPYHLVAEGEAVVRFEGATVDIPLQAGDVVIIPHGDAHTVSNGSPSKLIDSAASLGKFLGGDLRTMRLGGGGCCDYVCLRLLIGEGPLTYLARWRLQLAARLLQTTRKTIVQVASQVGYESEAAFNRAFKREFGLPPAKYRNSFSR